MCVFCGDTKRSPSACLDSFIELIPVFHHIDTLINSSLAPSFFGEDARIVAECHKAIALFPVRSSTFHPYQVEKLLISLEKHPPFKFFKVQENIITFLTQSLVRQNDIDSYLLVFLYAEDIISLPSHLLVNFLSCLSDWLPVFNNQSDVSTFLEKELVSRKSFCRRSIQKDRPFKSSALFNYDAWLTVSSLLSDKWDSFGFRYSCQSLFRQQSLFIFLSALMSELYYETWDQPLSQRLRALISTRFAEFFFDDHILDSCDNHEQFFFLLHAYNPKNCHIGPSLEEEVLARLENRFDKIKRKLTEASPDLKDEDFENPLMSWSALLVQEPFCHYMYVMIGLFTLWY